MRLKVLVYVGITMAAVIALVTVVLAFAQKLKVSTVHLKGQLFSKLFTFEIDLSRGDTDAEDPDRL